MNKRRKSNRHGERKKNPQNNNCKRIEEPETLGDLPEKTIPCSNHNPSISKIGDEISNGAILNNIKYQTIITGNDDIETLSDEEDEYIEYVFRSRQYFMHSICQVCKTSSRQPLVACVVCRMIYYCSQEHMLQDEKQHFEFCKILDAVSRKRGGHIFNKTAHLSCDEFRTLRVSTLQTCETFIQRQLLPYEKEVVLYPRLCNKSECREWRQNLLVACSNCGQVYYCLAHPEHLEKSHEAWCKPFKLFKEMICFQEKHGKISPVLPSNTLTQPLTRSSTISQVFAKLYTNLKDIGNVFFYSMLTQIASPPLTIWFGLNIAGLTHKSSLLIHLIGAEAQFEVDAPQKWEAFLLHINPLVQKLDIVFVGPELHVPEVCLEAVRKNKLCKVCRKNNRKINFNFENELYHDYLQGSSYNTPDLVCYFNPGLYRATGFNKLDTWPKTIKATVDAKCPVVVTSYTQFECPLDLKSYLKESHRPLNIILPPTMNPFRSQRPERNFISEEIAPLIFKNYYFFVLN